MAKALGVTEARRQFSNIVEQVQHQGRAYVVERYGKPAAAVVPVEVYERWQREQREFFAAVRELQQRADLSPEEAAQVAAEATAAVRDEHPA